MQNTKLQELVRLGPRMAHRVRDELAVIQAATDFLIEDKSISKEVRDKIALIKGHIGHAASVANSFLIITGNQKSDLTVLNVRNGLADLSVLIQRLLGENNMLQMRIDQDLWPIRGDWEHLENILLSLVVNAREAMPDGGMLRITAGNVTNVQANAESAPFEPDYVRIEVIDTGVGIPEDIFNRIFEPFFSTKKQLGCGFALAAVRHTVEKLNGHIRVASEVGKGTTFSVFLPRSLSEPLDSSEQVV